MNLFELPKIKISEKKKRLGRGYGSGKGGHTVGKGTKGQNSRGSRKFGIGFEGGQSPLYKKLPKLGGFKNKRAKQVIAINLSRLNTFNEDTKVTPQLLLEEGLIKKLPLGGVKLLAKGDFKKKLIFSGFSYSEKAKEQIKKSESKIND